MHASMHSYIAIPIDHTQIAHSLRYAGYIFIVISTEYVTTSKHHIELLVQWHIDKVPKVTLLHIVVEFLTGSAVDEPSKLCIYYAWL